MIRRPRAAPTIGAGLSSADRFYWLAALVSHRRGLGPPYQVWLHAEAIGCPVLWLKVTDCAGCVAGTHGPLTAAL